MAGLNPDCRTERPDPMTRIVRVVYAVDGQEFRSWTGAYYHLQDCGFTGTEAAEYLSRIPDYVHDPTP